MGVAEGEGDIVVAVSVGRVSEVQSPRTFEVVQVARSAHQAPHREIQHRVRSGHAVLRRQHHGASDPSAHDAQVEPVGQREVHLGAVQLKQGVVLALANRQSVGREGITRGERPRPDEFAVLYILAAFQGLDAPDVGFQDVDLAEHLGLNQHLPPIVTDDDADIGLVVHRGDDPTGILSGLGLDPMSKEGAERCEQDAREDHPT